MATIVTRTGKGSALTHIELDANFTNLNTEVGTATGWGNHASAGYLTSVTATNVDTGTEIVGKVLTTDGVGSATWEAPKADQVYINESLDDDANYNILFTSDTAPGDSYKGITIDDGGLGFNPGTNTLHVNAIQGWGTTNIDVNNGDGNCVLETAAAGVYVYTYSGGVRAHTSYGLRVYGPDSEYVALGTASGEGRITAVMPSVAAPCVLALRSADASGSEGTRAVVSHVGFDINTGTPSTSTTTGALTVAGGAGITENLYVGGNLNVEGGNVTVTHTGDVTLHLAADSNNVGENDNPTLRLSQDGGAVSTDFGMVGDADQIFTGSLANGAYILPSGSYSFQIATNGMARLNVLGTGETAVLSTTTSTSTTTGALTVAGGVGIGGALFASSKSFDIEHPTKEGMRLRHGCIEGPELGVYVRGKLLDTHIIELPDYWIGLVHEDSITVNLTPIGQGHCWVENIHNNVIEVGGHLPCFYTVFAERKDTDRLEVEYTPEQL